MTRSISFFDRFAKKRVLALLDRVENGEITVVDADGASTHGRRDPHVSLHATVRVLDARVYRAVLLGGTIGAGEAYARGEWRCDDLPTLVRIFSRDRLVNDAMDRGTARFTLLLDTLANAWLKRNTRRGSRRNIAAHYDLGNDFFRLFLDSTMMYSCGLFRNPDDSLLQAQTAKNDRICRKLDLRPDDHVLEIGTGWGGFAVHAASLYGCRVTTTTISREQYDAAVDRVHRAGLADRVEVRLEDYRDLAGTFDKIVSIEMIEAIGHEQQTTFFRTCAARLRPHGMMLLQCILIADRQYERARRGIDFIKKHIFPGSFIPSTQSLHRAMVASSDFRLVDFEDLTSHYPPTLRAWRASLHARAADARAIGYDDEFLRAWDFYFAYCEGGFEEHAIGLTQMLLARPMCRRGPLASTFEPHDTSIETVETP